jgi:hypothetical protein
VDRELDSWYKKLGLALRFIVREGYSVTSNRVNSLVVSLAGVVAAGFSVVF